MIRIAPSSTLLTWLGPQWFFPFPKFKKVAWWKEIFFKFWDHYCHKCLFWGVWEILFFGRIKKVRTSLEKVYHYERRLCRKIKCTLACILVFSFQSHGLIKLPSYLLSTDLLQGGKASMKLHDLYLYYYERTAAQTNI